MNSKNITAIGYTRSMKPDKKMADMACRIQAVRIKEYCSAEGIILFDILEDYGYKDDCRKKEKGLAKELGIPELENKYIPNGWGNLLNMMVHRKSDCILVDTKMRLARNEVEENIITRICNENDIRIIEIPPTTGDGGTSGIYIYHCTNNPRKRCGVVTNDIDELYIYSMDLLGNLAGLFLDMEFKERIQLENAIKAVGGGTLLVKNFLHVKRYTGACFSVFNEVEEKGGKVVSQEEGIIRSIDKATIQKLRESTIDVAYYDSQSHEYDKENFNLEIQKVKTYIHCHAEGWKMENEDIYVDEYGYTEQSKLEMLIENQDKYGVIIVSSYPRISEDISKFMKFVKRIHVPIYSMKEEL